MSKGQNMSGERLIVRFEGVERTFEPTNSPVRIGRDNKSDVVIEKQGVSRGHAEIAYVGGSWVYRDNQSTQGSFVGGERVTERTVSGSLTVTLARGEHAGQIELVTDPIVDDLDRTVAASPDATAMADTGAARPGGVLAPGAAGGATQVTGETVVVECGGKSHTFTPGRKYVIGRDGATDVVSVNPNVSRRHATLEFRDRWYLTDLDSSGGTFLDGKKTKEIALSGTMAFLLGDADAGERLVVKASGTRQVTMGQKMNRMGSGGKIGLIAAGVAAVALIVGIVGFLTLGGNGKPDFDELTRGVVSISVGDEATGGGTGSGTIINKERGLILTNAHVAGWGEGEGLALWYGYNEMWFQDLEDIIISVSPGLDRSAEPRFRARLVAVDGYLDLAVLEITETLSGKFIEDADLAELTEIPIGSVNDLTTGDDIFVMGFPGVARNSAVTLTEGNASGFVADERVGDNRSWVQMDAEIRGGNSGGLMADSSGKLIAIPSQATGIDIVGTGESSIAQSRSVDYAQPMIDAVLAGETYVSPYVTLLTGDEQITNVAYGTFVEAEGGIEYACTDVSTSTPAVGEQALGVQVNYRALVPNEHQDVQVLVIRHAIPADVQAAYADAGIALPQGIDQDTPIGFAQTSWKSDVPRADGCFTAAMGLQEQMLELVEYTVQVHVGGNLNILYTQRWTPTAS